MGFIPFTRAIDFPKGHLCWFGFWLSKSLSLKFARLCGQKADLWGGDQAQKRQLSKSMGVVSLSPTT